MNTLLPKESCVSSSGPVVKGAALKPEMSLSSFYKYDSFRPGQLEALIAVAHGKDVFVRMATGSGTTVATTSDE